MQKEDARKQSREVLHERRKQIIRMHKKGVGVMQIVEQTGLNWTGRRKLLGTLRIYAAKADQKRQGSAHGGAPALFNS